MLAFFVISTHLGGAERSLLDLVKVLKQHNKKFKIVVPKNSGPLIDQLDEAGIDCLTLSFPQWFLQISRKRWDHTLLLLPLLICYLPIYFFKLHRLLESYNITKVHSTGLKFHILLGIYAFCHRKLKLTIHLRDVFHSKVIRKLLQTLGKARNITLIANSKATAKSISPAKCKVIYNGFPKKPKPSKNKKTRKDFDLPEKKYLVGVVGAIARWKGQREFLLMARKLMDMGYNFHFIIVGDEIYDTEGDQGEMLTLRQYVRDFQISDRVSFLGFQNNPEEIYRLLDVLVHSSIEAEPFGRVIVEAMQEGCPVTASALGGPLEIIEDGKTGKLHEPANIQSMAEQVLYFHENPKETKKIIKAASQNLLNFSLETHVEKMMKQLHLS